MNIKVKEKLAGKSAYIALAFLLITILVFTVLAIIATVNSTEDVPPPLSEIPESGEPPVSEPPKETPVPDAPTIGEPSEPETPVPEVVSYVLPCEGAIQRDYHPDMLVFSPSMNDHRVHLGIDIAAKLGDPVKAIGKGTVERIYSDLLMGKTLVINHGGGLKSVYMNLANELPEGIEVGKTVESGSIIGAVGETAGSECVDSPHLHFEILLDGKSADPKNYITLPSSTEPDYEG